MLERRGHGEPCGQKGSGCARNVSKVGNETSTANHQELGSLTWCSLGAGSAALAAVLSPVRPACTRGKWQTDLVHHHLHFRRVWSTKHALILSTQYQELPVAATGTCWGRVFFLSSFFFFPCLCFNSVVAPSLRRAFLVFAANFPRWSTFQAHAAPHWLLRMNPCQQFSQQPQQSMQAPVLVKGSTSGG